MNTNRRLLTAGQLTAKLARTADLRTARAEMRCQVAAELGASPFDAAVKAEANRRIRSA
jgi:hypothetical protein